MKRAIIVGTGTVMGVAAVLALNPDGTVAAPSAAPAVSSGVSTGAGTPTGTTSSSSGTSSSSSDTAATADTATYTGATVDVGNGYGSIAVEVTVTDGRIVDITALELPQNDRRSASISQRAWPTLAKQALAAQSATVAGVSGASFTSKGFATTLRDALSQAGLAS